MKGELAIERYRTQGNYHHTFERFVVFSHRLKYNFVGGCRLRKYGLQIYLLYRKVHGENVRSNRDTRVKLSNNQCVVMNSSSTHYITAEEMT